MSIRLAFLLILFGQLSQIKAQSYGFEWIKPYQTYYKFKVGQNGIYHISTGALSSAGINLPALNPNKIQLFYQGKEVPIYIHGGQDGNLQNNDHIEFYGSTNNGFIDSFLYANKSWQPHPFVGLFTDTSVYFLTILPDTSTSIPLRFEPVHDLNFSGLTPEAYFIDTTYLTPTETYLDGPDIFSATEKYISSEYQDGEGWASERISWFNERTFIIKTKQPNTNGPQPKLEIKVIGASNGRVGNNLAFPNHHIQLDISTNNIAFTNIIDHKYKSYDVAYFQPTISPIQIGGNNTYLKFKVVNDLGLTSDFNSLSYALFTYSRLPDLVGENQKWLRIVHQQGQLQSYVRLSNVSTNNNAFVYDYTALKRIKAAYNSGLAEFKLNNLSKPSEVFVFDSTNFQQVVNLELVQFPVINPTQNYEYIVITHPLCEPAATNYVNYRNASYNTLKVYSDEIADYYFYGNKHPYGIRRFMEHLVKTQSQKPKYLFLAGRGYQNDKARFYSLASLNYNRNYNNNLVPGIGVPGADALYTNGIVGDGNYFDIPTGRLSAKNSQELQSYLDKIITHESQPDSIAAWRKNVLHISGGTSQQEQDNYKSILGSAGLILRDTLTGAYIKSYNKSSNLPTQIDLRDKIIADQNSGINMLSFLGHASLTILDVDIGGVNDLNNANKYPLYYFSGCNVGNATEEDPTTGGAIYANEYLVTPNKGGIGWLAHSNFTFDGFLSPLIYTLYDNYAKYHYGKSIGLLMYETCKRLSNPSSITRSHNLQWVFQGDPAVHLYNPTKADYEIKNNDFIVQNTNLSTQEQYLNLAVIVNNLAKTNRDSFTVTLTRRLPNNQTINYIPQRVAAIYFKDTLYFRIETLGELALGNNLFTVKVDASNEVDEISENNNLINVDVFIPGNGSVILFPPTDGLVETDTVLLTVQNNNLLATQCEYLIEIDTVASLNSPFKKVLGPITDDALLTYPFVALTKDSVTYYWRARLNLPENQGGRWSNGVFTKITSDASGWIQRNYDRKITYSATEFLQFDTTNNIVDFTENSKNIKISANRIAHGGRGVFYDGENQNPGALNCVGSNGFSVILIDKRTLKMFVNPKYPLNCQFVIDNNNTPGKRKLFYYSFSANATGQYEFKRFVDSLDEGTYVAVFSQYNSGCTTWDTDMRNAFAKIGSTKVASANDVNTAFVLIGIKGALPGSIDEDTSTVIDITADVSLTKPLYGFWYTGSAWSAPIGPASSWDKLKYYFNPSEGDGSDVNTVDVYGINTSGEDTLIYTNIHTNAALNGINAKIYPYLKLKYTLFDTVYRTPDQLNYWLIHYKPLPEGTISAADSFSFYASTVDQGDSLKLHVPFKNIGKIAFDSIPVLIKLTDANRIVKYEYASMHKPLTPEQTDFLTHQIATYGLDGTYGLEVYFNSGFTPEYTKINNYLFKPVTIVGDKVNPRLEVTFDGYRIVNGDFISPTPTIRIASKDNSKYNLQADTALFTVYLRKPGLDYERLNLGDAAMLFKPAVDSNNLAELIYKPNFTEDGKYALKVINKDANGNLSGKEFYEVDFEVQQKSTITNFFPYPNPATTNVRFVFTLTGAVPPDELLIRIMTITGKVVKEITLQEFGPIKIGQNISEYAWDGTDNYGDRLANGVYLYQVFTKINKTNIEHRSLDKADQFFAEQVGKIYLLR